MPEPEIPFAELEFVNGEVVGVRCPACGELIASDDPVDASNLYVGHFLSNHEPGTI